MKIKQKTDDNLSYSANDGYIQQDKYVKFFNIP